MAVALAFADPVRDAQGTFRAVMNAMARPGSIQPVAGLAGAPAPLSPTAAAIAVALADYETPLWLDPALAAAPDVGAWLTFHTGARIIAEPARAAFASSPMRPRFPVWRPSRRARTSTPTAPPR